MSWIVLCTQVPVSLAIIAYLLNRWRRAELECDVLRGREQAYAAMIARTRQRFTAHADQAVAVTRIAPAYVMPTAKQLTEWSRYAAGHMTRDDVPTVVRRTQEES